MKNQKGPKLNEIRQSTDANTEMTAMLELPVKDFKTAMIKTIQLIVMNLLETNENRKSQRKRGE